jgi:cell division transport system permease protein
MFLSLRRIVRSGLLSFWRNGFVSASSVVVMTITLFVVTSLFFINALLESSLSSLQEKVDINAYFVIDTEEEEMKKVENALRSLQEVESVVFTSREDALLRFQERHKEDALEMQAIDALDENPLLASLSIRASEPQYYEQITHFLETNTQMTDSSGTSLIAKIDFNNNREAINRLRDIIHGIELFGIIVSSALIFVSIVIIFNTIRMAIYISREEIAVMRLVGASDMYVRGPFIIEGMIYGALAGLFVLIIFYPLTLWLGPGTEFFFGTINIFSYYVSSFGLLAVSLLLGGASVGAFASFLAVRKYLR